MSEPRPTATRDRRDTTPVRNDRNERGCRHLRLAYIGALSLVALMTLVGHGVLRSVIADMDATAGVASLRRIELGVSVCTLLVLLAIARPIFEPAVRRIRRLGEAGAPREQELEHLATITELVESRCATEDALREIEAFRTATDEHSLVSIADRSGRIIEANTGFCRISGYERDELIGQDHRILNSGVHPKSFWSDVWRTIASGKAWRGEVCNRAKDGSLYWVDSTIIPYLGTDGKPEKYVSMRLDISEMKRLHEELRDAQSLLTETGRAACIGGWTMDMKTMSPVWSDEVCRIHEVPMGHVPGLDEAINYYAPEARETIERAVQRGIEQGLSWDLELPFITARGNHRWVRAMGTPVMVDGACVKLWGAFQDITDVAQAKRDLEQLQSRFAVATEGVLDGPWDYVPATGEVWYSDQFKTRIGLEPHEFDGFEPVLDSFVEILHPDDKDPTFAAIESHLQDDTPYDVKYRMRMTDGEYRWFRARGRSIRDEEGQVIRMSGSITDIHEQHVLESRFDLATRAARIGLWDWDVPSGETYFSDTFYTMLGYEPGELPMNLETWTVLAHPDDVDGALEGIQRHCRGETDAYLSEHRLKCRDGSWLWVRDIGEVVERHEDGSPKRMIGVHVDIQATREAMERANAANLAKSEFLANMSHEIRTPMTAILGYADLLDADGDQDGDPAGIADAIQTIRGNANHLMAVINDILDMSKIEAGRMSVERIDTRPAQIVEEVASLVQPRAQGKGIEFSVQYDTPIPERIQSDQTRLRQILLNLAGNAIKFTEVGTVTIHAACDPATERMRFRVVDTGIGMSPEQRDTIARFDAFNQADTSTSRRFGGTGLGLRISNSLAQLLGGGIEVESVQGAGSAFTVTVSTGDLDGVPMLETDRLPSRAERLSRPEPESATEPDRPLDGVRILLAEDGPANQQLISFHLRAAGAVVTVAEHGRIAVEIIESANEPDRPDLVLMDMQMPELDGYDATRRLRDGGYTRPIIALTAHAMDGDRRKCLDAGCDDYLTKPIDRPKLIETCRSWAVDGGSVRHRQDAA